MCEQCNQLEPEQTPVTWGQRHDFVQIGQELLDQANPDEFIKTLEWIEKAADQEIVYV